MKTIFSFMMLLSINSLMLFEKANAQIKAPLPPCDPAQRITVPQLAKVCSVKPGFTPVYTEWAKWLFNRRWINANQIPNHTIGIFPINDDICGSGRPTPISPHDTTFYIPARVGARGISITWLHIPEKFGIALNGVIFDPLADEWWKDSAKYGWEKNSLLHPDMTTDLDCNNAHIQGDSTYHYHGLPTGLYELLSGSAPPYPWLGTRDYHKAKVVQLGWAFDGTPLYGPLCSEPDSLGAGKYNWWKPKSGWALRTGTRTAPPKGPGGAYNGDYDSDYVYINKFTTDDTLDAVNGHFAPTPEYPDGIYHQHITEEFPYIPRGYLNTLAPLASSASEIAEKPNANHFKAYPNPAQNIFYVQLTGKAVFTLISAEGKAILTTAIDTKGEINTNTLSAGLYYLKNNATGEVQKIILDK